MAGEVRSSAWTSVVAYAAVSAANQMLWLTYTPITTDAAHHYGVSEGAIGWLAEIFPLVYVLLALPAGRLIDRRMPFWLGLGAVLTAAGGLVRLAGDGYAVVLAGQVLVALAQPLILNAVTSVSASQLRPADRATGIAVSSAGIFAGMVLALALGAALGTARLGTLLLIQAIVSVVAALVLCAALRTATARAAVPDEIAAPSGAAVPLRAVWADGYLRRLIGLVCVGFGVFIALTTWLQALLEPAGVSEGAAGGLLLALVLAGVAGSIVLPAAIARRRRELRFVRFSIVVSAVGMVVLAARPGFATGLVVCLAVGVVLLTDLPVILELVERRAGSAEGTASAFVWLAGNAAGLLAALAVQLLVDTPAAAFALLAGVLLVGVPIAHSLRGIAADPEPRATVAASEGM
jgi:predicted MFS family arabinose efflux permease